jgi:predicted methyltransferase
MRVRAAVRNVTGPLTFAAVVAVCISMTTVTAQESLPDYAAIIAAPDRTEADLQTDKRRDPLKFLAFTGARPGMRVLDMGAGGGYSTELMACSCPGRCGVRPESYRSRRASEDEV